MPIPELPEIPTFCDVCCMYPAENLVPERFLYDDWTIDVYCPLCLDDFLSQFPIDFKKLRERETTGKYKKTGVKGR